MKDFKPFPRHYESIGADVAGDNTGPKTVACLDHDPLRTAVNGIGREEHTRHVGHDEFLNHYGHRRVAMIKLVVDAVGDCTIAEQREPAGADRIQHGLITVDV